MVAVVRQTDSPLDSPPHIAVLLTCFNRRDSTLECLDRLRRQGEFAPLLEVIVVDDGSTDGTAEAIARSYPDVTVIDGGGDLFWCRGMARAFEHVQAQVDVGAHRFSHVLMLNDDTAIADDAIASLLDTEKAMRPGSVVVVGEVADPDTGALTYGGFVRSGLLSRLRFDLRPLGDDRPLVTMNGNCVLIPWSVIGRIGFVDPTFHHRFGDLDLGLRASEAGVPLVVTRRPVGTCVRNPHSDVTSHAQGLTFRQWLAHVFSPKGIQLSDWLPFTRRHGGPLWPFFFARAYVLAILRWPLARFPRRSR